MKKILSLVILFSLTVGAFSFTENHPRKHELIQKKKPVAENWTVSEYGFLIFPAVSDLDEYIDLLKTKTHAQAQSYLETIEFSSLGATLYTGEYENEMVTGEQAIDYALTEQRVLQIQDVIIKPVGETDCEFVKWEFILAMRSENLNSSSYENIANGIFDENTMNKFATNPVEEETDLITFMADTPAGYEETEANECPPSLEERRRPFWGHGQSTCTAYNCFHPPSNQMLTCYRYCEPSYYIFWINVDKGECNAYEYGVQCPPPGTFL